HTVHALLAEYDLGRETSVNARPGIVLWIGARVGADAPYQEFLGVRRALENIGVVAVKAAFQLDHGDFAAVELHDVIMAVGLASRIPVLDEIPVLHKIQDALHKLALVAHGCRKLAAHALDRAPKQSAII